MINLAKINCTTVNESPIKFPQRKGSLPESENVSDHSDKSKHGSASNLQSVSHKDPHRLDIDPIKDHKVLYMWIIFFLFIFFF